VEEGAPTLPFFPQRPLLNLASNLFKQVALLNYHSNLCLSKYDPSNLCLDECCAASVVRAPLLQL
jgi:hypothetical protein